MAFTGYVFPSSQAISPHLEYPQTGPTSLFCAELASRLQCYVVAGYPERLAPQEMAVQQPNNQKVGANSAIIYGPTGEWVSGYRKTNLFASDMSWAKAGTGFITIPMTIPPSSSSNAVFSKLNLTIAICMDLNPFPPAVWTLSDGPYELAEHCLESKTRVLLMLNAWLHSRDESFEDEDTEKVGDMDEHKGPDWDTVRYWTQRLSPLWRDGHWQTVWRRSGGHAGDTEEGTGEETAVIVCNRIGTEKGVTFAGSSVIFHMERGSGRPGVFNGPMGTHEEGLRVWKVSL